MKRRTTFAVMALAAMFACSTPSDAQFGLGKLTQKVRKAVGVETRQEKEEKIRQHKRDSIKAVMASITPTIPQPAAEGTAPVAIKWKGTQIGMWDPVALVITFNQTYDDGAYAGQKVTYKLDPATGKWKSKKGTDVGQMSNDGTIVSPNLGTIKLNPQTNKVVRNGEVIGEVTMLSAYSYGTTIGGFDAHVSPLLVAFTFHGSLISEKQIAEWKEAKKQCDLAAAKARQEAAARAASSSITSSSSSNSSMELWRGGSRFGEIKPNDEVYMNGSYKGKFSGSDIYVGGSYKGKISGNEIWKDGKYVGKVSSGDVYIGGSRVGEVKSNGDVYKGGSYIGRVTNMRDANKVAVIYFFDFF